MYIYILGIPCWLFPIGYSLLGIPYWLFLIEVQGFLDVGAANGTDALYQLRRGAEVVAVEANPMAIEKLRLIEGKIEAD